MPSSTKTVFALNGFLGRASDWGVIDELLPAGWTLQTIELLAEPPIEDFNAWAEQFNGKIQRSTDSKSVKVLLGYSMGGRLAMHSLVKSPALFNGAVIVSANPGLLNEDECRLRREADEIWAGKFLQEPWPELMKEWDSQAALRPPKSPGAEMIKLERSETDFQRPVLAEAMRTWSLGKQKNLRPNLAHLKIPIELVTGKDDLKFTSVAHDFIRDHASGPRSHAVVENAGHRVPWDAPAQFRAILAKFLSRW